MPAHHGPVALLQKPFTPRELRRRIRDVLDR
jgi:DNA-binding response OmpR family regulator